MDEATKNIFKIVNRTIDLYMKEAGVRALFGFDPRLEELILSTVNGHGYQANVPMVDLIYFITLMAVTSFVNLMQMVLLL